MFSHCIEGTHIYCFCREHDANKINYMYAQYVKNTMEPLNIPDVAKDKRFPWTVSNLILDLMHTSCFPFRLYLQLLLVCWTGLETGCLRVISLFPAQGRDDKIAQTRWGSCTLCFSSVLWIVTNQHVQVEVIYHHDVGGLPQMDFLTLTMNIKVPVVWMHETGNLLNELLLSYPFALTVKLQRCVLQTFNILNTSVFFNLSKMLACDAAALILLPAYLEELFQTLEV